MVEVARTFTVRTPLATVVNYLTDWGNSREWDPGTITCTKLTDGPVAVGTRWHNVLRLLRRKVDMVFRLDHADANRLVFTGENRGATSVDTITCTALDDGGTSINYHSDVAYHRLAKLAAPLLTRELERIGDTLITQMTTALHKLP